MVTPNVFHPSNGYRFFYVRDRHDNPVGVIVTRVVSGDAKPIMGWSLCKRKEDRFTRAAARFLATDPTRMVPIPPMPPPAVIDDTPMNRALTALSKDMTVPHTIRAAAKREIERREDMEYTTPRAATPTTEATA